MRKTLATCAFITFTLCGGGAAFAAEPSLHEVYQAADSGHVEQAQRMMQNVLQAHPDSAKAHYVEAELLARQGLLAQARSELATARRLAPGLPFASEHSVSELERTLRTGGNATPASNHPSSYAPPTAVTASDSGFPWGWLIGGIGLLAAFAFFLRGLNQRQNPSGYGPAGYPGNPGPTLYRGPQPQPAAPGGGSVAYPPAPGYGYPQPAAPAPAPAQPAPPAAAQPAPAQPNAVPDGQTATDQTTAATPHPATPPAPKPSSRPTISPQGGVPTMRSKIQPAPTPTTTPATNSLDSLSAWP